MKRFAIVLVLGGCSIRGMAIHSMANALSEQGDLFGSDDDPELVRDASAFGLKTYEALLASEPAHQGLLLAAARGFTQYGYAFVEGEADRLEDVDPVRARAMRKRARKLYLRAHRYALRGLDARHPGCAPELAADPKAALAKMTKEDVPLLYWAGASWALAVSASKDDLDLVAQLGRVEPIMRRALELDESFERGAIHEFFIAFDGSRSEAMGGSPARARKHFERAIELNHGMKASAFVSLAESVAVGQQNLAEFKQLLERALAIPPDAVPALRLENTISQRRAAWLLSRVDALFVAQEEVHR